VFWTSLFQTSEKKKAKEKPMARENAAPSAVHGARSISRGQKAFSSQEQLTNPPGSRIAPIAYASATAGQEASVPPPVDSARRRRRPRLNGLTYGQLIHGLKAAGVTLDRQGARGYRR